MRKVPIQAVPNAKRTLQALRRIGYDFNSAVADLVDNSISAQAKSIEISVKSTNFGFHVHILDNGLGMSRDRLLEAMKLGSESEYGEDSLGKYGMGLKTASLSQCTSFLVVSKSDGEMPSGFLLDIDHIIERNEWELLELDSEDLAADQRFQQVIDNLGTIVLWQHLDQLEGEYRSFQRKGAADNWFGRSLNDLKLHLRSTFHRFLEGTAAQGRKVGISLNGEVLTPWDPFCRQEPFTACLRSYEFEISEAATPVKVRIEPYVLPNREGERAFSSSEAWQEAAGLLAWNDSQGYYVYRRDRLIHCGGWLRTRSKDEHIKYARIGIFFEDGADDLFSLSVNKAQIRLPASLFSFLKSYVNSEVVKAAQTPYRSISKTKRPVSIATRRGTSVAKTLSDFMTTRGVEVHGTKGGEVRVINPKGSFIANTEKEAFPFKQKAKFSVQRGLTEDNSLWNTVCKPDGGFTVILNCDHPFTRRAQENGSPAAAALVDSLLLALGYAELRTAGSDSRHVFDELRQAVSELLEAAYEDKAEGRPSISGTLVASVEE